MGVAGGIKQGKPMATKQRAWVRTVLVAGVVVLLGCCALSWRSSAALPRALCAATRRVPKAKVITTFCIETICLIPQR